MTELPYRDAALPVKERVADLPSRMTLKEKAGQLIQFFHMGTGEFERNDLSGVIQ